MILHLVAVIIGPVRDMHRYARVKKHQLQSSTFDLTDVTRSSRQRGQLRSLATAAKQSLVGNSKAILHTAAANLTTLANVFVHTAHFFCFNLQ